MNRRPTGTILLSSFFAGMLPVILAVVTGTGTTGAYIFAFLIIPILLVFLMWPERTRFFIDKSHWSRGSSRNRNRRPRAL